MLINFEKRDNLGLCGSRFLRLASGEAPLVALHPTLNSIYPATEQVPLSLAGFFTHALFEEGIIVKNLLKGKSSNNWNLR